MRFLLYLTAYLLPVFHPAIVVSYDAATRLLWFLFVPLQMHVAFFGRKDFFRAAGLRASVAFSAAIMIVSIVLVAGMDRSALFFLAAQAAAFLLTAALFRTTYVGRFTGVVELAYIALLYVKMLGFSRASETFAEAGSGITQGILALSFGAILLHALVLYLAAYQEGVRKRTVRELSMFAAAAAVLGVVVALVVPPDFVNHSVVLNELGDPPDPELVPLDERGNGLDGGNLLSDGRDSDSSRDEGGSPGDGAGQADSESGRTPRLQGIDAADWNRRRSAAGVGAGADGEGERTGSGEREGKQYAVMIVGSDHDPIYAADGYFSAFDSRRGFQYSTDEPLNELTYARLLETWRNPAPALDLMREDTDVFFLSTIPERVTPYDPYEIEPTVLDTRYHPFDYAYSVTASISASTPRQWREISELTPMEREELARYLEIELVGETGRKIEAFAERLFANTTGYYERLQAILSNFTTYQYEMGFTDDVSVEAVGDFLLDTKSGDCTEFSNSTAILARLAGIPSRVVTGYLAAKSLQTDRHRQGLAILQEAIEPLQSFPIDSLYLVTSAHRHSWTQVIMPGYGWVDIETTATAIPPIGAGDPNSMDVVIPIITPEEILDRSFRFPWLLVGQALLLLALAAFASAYLFRFGRRLYLSRISKGTSRRSLGALYSLLLYHLAAEGYPLKPASETSLEYARRHPETASFAERYTRLRYREPENAKELQLSWSEVRDAYRNTRRVTRRGGVVGLAKRIASLRELRY